MIDLHTFVGGWFAGLVTGASLMRWRIRISTPHRERQPSFAELLMPPPRDRDPDWRRSFNHENTNRPSGPPPLKFLQGGNIGVQPLILSEGRTQRGNGAGGPTTPKPNIIPKGQGGPINPPPQNP